MPESVTKKCPYCGEKIHAEAVKCRFCREFLEDADGLPVSYHDRRVQHPAADEEPSRLTRRTAPLRQAEIPLFSVSPSLWGLAGVYFFALLFLAAGAFLWRYPVGDWILKLPNVTEALAGQIAQYIRYAGIGLILITIGNCVIRTARLKSIHYEVSTDRIEFARGIFSRHIDNLDMFRVIDLKLHRSLLDCIVGVGTVTLTTKDETDPVFEFEKVARPKMLYDILKKASLEADRKQGVIHLD